MRRGFTLIELVIVIAICGILLVLLCTEGSNCAGRVGERCLTGQVYLYDRLARRYVGPKLTAEGKPVSCAEAE